jgi:hypothetical protein
MSILRKWILPVLSASLCVIPLLMTGATAQDPPCDYWGCERKSMAETMWRVECCDGEVLLFNEQICYWNYWECSVCNVAWTYPINCSNCPGESYTTTWVNYYPCW